MTNSSSIAIIGLGLLGSSLAERLNEDGFEVIGYDINHTCRDQFQSNGGTVVNSLEELLKPGSRVVLSLPNSDISLDVTRQILATNQLPQIVIDTTTGHPSDMEYISELLLEKGIHYLDATVGGSSVQVTSRDIILMIGGEKSAVEFCEDIWKCWSKEYFHLGPAGSGAKMKLVMNLILGLNRAVLAEGIAFSKSLGLKPESTLRILQSSPAYSRVMDSKGQKMIEKDFEPQARLAQHLKDVRLILSLAEENNQSTPLSFSHENFLSQLCDLGMGDLDNSAIINFFDTQESN